MKIQNLPRFYIELDKRCDELALQWSSVLTRTVSVAPTLPNSTLSFRRPRTWLEYLIAIIVSWYIPERGTRIYVQYDLMQMRTKFGIDKVSVALTLLSSKPEMRLFLAESNLFKNERHFFGLLLSSKESLLRLRYRWLQPHKAKRLVRRKGYKDHGSLRPATTWLPKYDYTFDEKQREIELERIIQEVLSQLFLGGLP